MTQKIWWLSNIRVNLIGHNYLTMNHMRLTTDVRKISSEGVIEDSAVIFNSIIKLPMQDNVPPWVKPRQLIDQRYIRISYSAWSSASRVTTGGPLDADGRRGKKTTLNLDNCSRCRRKCTSTIMGTLLAADHIPQRTYLMNKTRHRKQGFRVTYNTYVQWVPYTSPWACSMLSTAVCTAISVLPSPPPLQILYPKICQINVAPSLELLHKSRLRHHYTTSTSCYIADPFPRGAKNGEGGIHRK